jgi:hypothetical protein
MAEQEKRPKVDRYLAPKHREVRVITGEAREAIDELINAARKPPGNRTAELIAIVLQLLIQGEESISKDLEYIRVRLDSIEKNLQSQSQR